MHNAFNNIIIQVTGIIGDRISTISYYSKLNNPVEFTLYTMKFEKEFEVWPECQTRVRKWVHEDEVVSLNLSPLVKCHLSKIVEFLHSNL